MTFKQWTDFVIQYKVYTAIRETLFLGVEYHGGEYGIAHLPESNY